MCVAKRLSTSPKDSEVLAPPTKKVKEECDEVLEGRGERVHPKMPTDHGREPVPAKMPPQNGSSEAPIKKPPSVKHVPEAWKLPLGDGTSAIRLRVSVGPQAKVSLGNRAALVRVHRCHWNSMPSALPRHEEGEDVT